MSDVRFTEDKRWAGFGITSAFLETKANWISEQRKLHGTCNRFFMLAGTLISFSRFDYLLTGLAFYQSVFGLERALRLHYETASESFATLLKKSVSEGLVADSLFQDLQPLSKELLKLLDSKPPTHAETLCMLVPKLRNQYAHGNYLLYPEFLHLTFQMREIADVLSTNRQGLHWQW